jgi:hypothetical protein
VTPSVATIDEVPAENRGLVQSIHSLIQSVESRGDLSPAARKAVQDAKAKLPLVFTALRDRTIDPEMTHNLGEFIHKLLGKDIEGAAEIKKQSLRPCGPKSSGSSIILFINYIFNAMK